MPIEIQRLTDQFLHNPKKIEVERKATAASTVTQKIVRVSEKDPKAKRAALRNAIDSSNVRSAIIFCNRKRDVDTLARSLARHKYQAAPIHGDLPQSVRTATLARFKAGDITLLVASDVAARGLDIADVSHVFNFDIPRHPEDYIHRIGRTGRAGKTGDAISIIGPEDRKGLAAVEELLGCKIEEAEHVKLGGAKPQASDPRAPERTSGDGDAPRSRRSTRNRRGAKTNDAPKAALKTDSAPSAATDETATKPKAEAKAPTESKAEPQSTSKPDAPAQATTNTPAEAPAETPAEAPAETPKDAPSRSQSDKPRSRGRRTNKDGDRPPKDANKAANRNDRPQRDQANRNQKDRGRDSAEVGLGEHTPAFLLRTPPDGK